MTSQSSSFKIPYWNINLGSSVSSSVISAIDSRFISQGPLTTSLEQQLASLLSVRDVVMVPSGSIAITLALYALGIGPGDDVVIPNRAWIAAAHAVLLLGANPILVDASEFSQNPSFASFVRSVTPATKAIIPVHLNGQSTDIESLHKYCRHNSIYLIEDAAQALLSISSESYLGTFGDIGCFSLSITKLLTSGQGGFCTTNNPSIGDRLRNMRTHGVENVLDFSKWNIPSHNFKYTDLQASLVLPQLLLLEGRISHLNSISGMYLDNIRHPDFVPHLALQPGNIVIYNEFIVSNRDSVWIPRFIKAGIQVRPFYPNISSADYISSSCSDYPNSCLFQSSGLYLPGGPDFSLDMVCTIIKFINSFI